jgi:hypothetical protein
VQPEESHFSWLLIFTTSVVLFFTARENIYVAAIAEINLAANKGKIFEPAAFIINASSNIA